MSVTADISPEELARFEKTIADLLFKTGVDVVRGVKKVTFDLLARIIRKTPVDTGRARAAWTAFHVQQGREVSISGPNVSAKEVKEGIREGQVFTNLPVQGSRSLQTSAGDNVFVEITNNVKYILPLEFGWSKQSPGGMVRISIREVADHYARELLELEAA